MIKFDEIKNIMEEARKKYFTDNNLETNPAIYYMNGNDGTEFDWNVNERCCEFYIFKPNGDGLIKFLAEKNNKYTMYVYDYEEPFNDKIITLTGTLSIDTHMLACHLQGTYDDKEIWDSAVTSWEADNYHSLMELWGDDEDID